MSENPSEITEQELNDVSGGGEINDISEKLKKMNERELNFLGSTISQMTDTLNENLRAENDIAARTNRLLRP